jgi:DNA-binding winged helix-turn-helix (wHTH) protein/tetratricopeptide (TPR) repeat protein
MKTEGIFRFGEGYQVDALARTLRRQDEVVTLNRRAFDVLLYLVQNPGRVLTRDELLKNVWPDTFVDESSLVQSIHVLRRALTEKPGDNNYIVTLPGRGYQFVSPVKVAYPESLSVVPDGAGGGNTSDRLLLERQTIRTSIVTEEQTSSGTAAASEAPAVRLPTVGKIAAVALLVAVLLAGGVYYRSHATNRLTDKDTIVLADFANSTGDAIFDDTLRTALSISLRQSPFLNVLPDSAVTKTRKLMTLPAGTKLTPDVARELCQRAGSKVYIAGAIGSLGSKYVLELKAINCQTGDSLAEEEMTAASKEKVLDVLGKATSKLRGGLGESLATVQRFDVPLAQATTSSLEALKAYSQGVKTGNEKGGAAALPYFERAIELDPNFAVGYSAVGNAYHNLGAPGRASEYISRAFQLREHASDRERMGISAGYYRYVTGELDKAIEADQEQIESYPRTIPSYANLGIVFAEQGQFEKAIDMTRTGMRLAPDRVTWYINLACYTLAEQRLDEARQAIQQARARNLDDSGIHDAVYALAFLGSDSAAMAEQQRWYAGTPEYETGGLGLASDTEAYVGHLQKARALTNRAVDSAVRADNKEAGAMWQAISAQREAAYGNTDAALQTGQNALKLAPSSQGVEGEAALAFALGGDTARAAPLAEDLEKRFPLDTQIQLLWLPAIEAQMALNRKKPEAALTRLRSASNLEFGLIPFLTNLSCLYPTYVRGEAYLADGQGRAAAVEFQKIIDHNGTVWNCWTGALSHLGVARANALQSRTSQGADADAARVRALAAYKDFLALWKDADADIPVVKQARAEYAKMQ